MRSMGPKYGYRTLIIVDFSINLFLGLLSFFMHHTLHYQQKWPSIEVSACALGLNLTSPIFFHFIREIEFSLKGVTVVIFATFRKMQFLFFIWKFFENYLKRDDGWSYAQRSTICGLATQPTMYTF